MSLAHKQMEFSHCLGKLLLYAYGSGQPVIVAEVFRPPEQAALMAEQGKGIRNSVHTKKLAADLFRFKNNTVSWDVEDYKDLAAYWKNLHADARWGGDFKSVDAVHFSFQHNGAK